MKKILWLMLIAVFSVFSSGEAFAYRRRHHVYIRKPAQLDRRCAAFGRHSRHIWQCCLTLRARTSCDPSIAVSTGPGDPGFDANPVGNYLVPAIYRSECQGAPK